jgi:hypothetical protein
MAYAKPLTTHDRAPPLRAGNAVIASLQSTNTVIASAARRSMVAYHDGGLPR